MNKVTAAFSSTLFSNYFLIGLALAQPTPILITQGLDGQTSNGWSIVPIISGDGTTVCFSSNASNLSSDDNNGRYDRFLWRNNVVVNLSDTPTGTQGNKDAYAYGGCALSFSGRYIAFATAATNTDPGLTSAGGVIYVDTVSGDRISFSAPESADAPGDSFSHAVHGISDDGKKVLFSGPSVYSTDELGNSTWRLQLYLWNKESNISTLITKTTAGNPASFSNYDGASMSSRGRYIYFASVAPDITFPHLTEPAGYGSPNWYTIDMNTGAVTRFTGEQRGRINPNGSKIFLAKNEVGIFSRPLGDPNFTLLHGYSNETTGVYSLSETGKYAVLDLDYDAGIFNTETGVAIPLPGSSISASLSRNGSKVVYDSLSGGTYPALTFDIYLSSTNLSPDAP